MGATHEGQCKICMILSPKDIEALEIDAVNRKDTYLTIGGKYGVKYGVKITKQIVSNHMKWLKERRLNVNRDKLLEEQEDKLLDTLEEHEKIHKWLWDKIHEAEELKKGATPSMMLRVANSQDRFIKSLLKGLGLLAGMRGEVDRDTRKLDISLVLKNLSEDLKIEEAET